MKKSWLSKIRELDIEELRDVVSKEYTYQHVLDYFKITNTRSNTLYDALRKVMDENKIDYSHFGYKKLRNLSEILVENSDYYQNTLKKRLLAENLIQYVCEICGNIGEWHGKTLVLQLDHKNGKNKDNRLENLRMLCPNCHSQTDTFGGRNLKKSVT